jgi:hypothetical protein
MRNLVMAQRRLSVPLHISWSETASHGSEIKVKIRK